MSKTGEMGYELSFLNKQESLHREDQVGKKSIPGRTIQAKCMIKLEVKRTKSRMNISITVTIILIFQLIILFVLTMFRMGKIKVVTKPEVGDGEGDKIIKAATDMEAHHQPQRLSIIIIIIITTSRSQSLRLARECLMGREGSPWDVVNRFLLPHLLKPVTKFDDGFLISVEPLCGS